MSENKLCRCFWLQGTLRTESPMLIGNGQNENSDNDLLLGGDGKPYIPGTLLAGVIRSALKGAEGLPEQALATLFGDDIPERRQSMVILHDARLLKQSRIYIRDGIEIGELTKTAKDQSKYNFEVLNPGAEFQFRMEIPVREKFRELPVLQFISNLLAFMESGNLRIGAKTTRGYGKLSLNQLCFRDLKLDGVEAMKEYLNFRWEKLAGKTPETLPEPTYVNPYTCITIPLHTETLLIRNYVMDNTAADGSNLNVDCEQLHVNGRAAIPGSAWAGIFRHKASEFLRELAPEKEKKLISELFGTDKEEVDEKRKSKVIFDESYDTKDGKSRFRDVMRTKIDRFSGGVCKGALFGERLAVGCDFELELRVRDKKDYEIGLLLLVAKEIGSGLAAVGGTTGVGRGVMKENGAWKCDGAALTEKEIQAYWDALAKKLEEEA